MNRRGRQSDCIRVWLILASLCGFKPRDHGREGVVWELVGQRTRPTKNIGD